MTGRSRDAAYWRHRIERDYGEIAERLRTGEIKSVRAAAIEAGLIRDASPLLELRRAWRRAGPEERAAFMAEVVVTELAQPALEVQPLQQRRVVHGDVAGEPRSPSLPFNLPPLGEKSAAISNQSLTPTARPAVPIGASASGLNTAYAKARDISIPVQSAASMAVPGTRLPGGEGAGRGGAIPERPRSGVRRWWGLVSAKDGQENLGGKGEAHGAHPSGVAVGQRYIKIDAGPGAWEVVSIFAGPQDVSHARIASLEEPDTVRTVSIAVLTDRNRYRPIH